MTTISESFGELGITITKSQIAEIEKMAIYFSTRKTHPLTFNGMALGVHPIAFTTADNNALFDVFGIRRQVVEQAIRETSTIDKNFIVTSDPYNLLVMWLCHLAPIYIKDKKVCREFSLNLMRLFLYKVFCSVVNNSFRHGASEGVAASTVASLSRKSDIVKYESWKKLIDVQCEKIIDPEERFYKILVDGAPDDLFLRVISESQTAIRAKVVTYAVAYYEVHASGDSVKSQSAISQNADGERILVQTASVIDSATQSMVSEILNPNMFVHDTSIQDVVGMFTTISPRMLKTALLRINETAVLQTSSRTFDKVQIDKEGTLYIGVRALVIEVIRSMVRICRERRINMGNRSLVFETIRDAYRSSRSLDVDIVAIKRSVAHLTDSFDITVNDAYKAAIRLAVIYYLVYRCLIKMK